MKRTQLDTLVASYEEQDKNGGLTAIGKEYLEGLKTAQRLQNASAQIDIDIQITQEELDNVIKNSTFINKSEVLNCIDVAVGDMVRSLNSRSAAEQTIVGNMLTVIEANLTGEVKKLKTKRI